MYILTPKHVSWVITVILAAVGIAAIVGAGLAQWKVLRCMDVNMPFHLIVTFVLFALLFALGPWVYGATSLLLDSVSIFLCYCGISAALWIFFLMSGYWKQRRMELEDTIIRI